MGKEVLVFTTRNTVQPTSAAAKAGAGKQGAGRVQLTVNSFSGERVCLLKGWDFCLSKW